MRSWLVWHLDICEFDFVFLFFDCSEDDPDEEEAIAQATSNHFKSRVQIRFRVHIQRGLITVIGRVTSHTILQRTSTSKEQRITVGVPTKLCTPCSVV